ncbi:hypothetical protein JTB14_019556 [Gonioctena quinquepunctata]|nr:hypothetical protein JTB14_019556 [Gonioctena quinquepunctata]
MELVCKPENSPVIDSKWVFRMKFNNNCKARLVVRTFHQTDVDTDIYAPLASVKIILSLIAVKKLHVMQMNVRIASLNSDVYIREPLGFREGEKLCK